jgi:hypothetical protein
MPNGRGGIEIFWDGQAGIYHVTLSAEGEVQKGPTLLIGGGRDINVKADQEGILHLVWLQDARHKEVSVYYASFDAEQRRLRQQEEMSKLFLRTGQIVQEPVVGFDADTGYVLWVVQDLKYITSSAQYASFPLEIPRQKSVRDLELEEGGNPQSPWVVRNEYDTFLVALTETVMTPNGPQLQIGVITLRGEGVQGEHARGWPGLAITFPASQRTSYWSNVAAIQGDHPVEQVVVTASNQPSLKPSLAVGATGDLHLAWLETGGFGTYRVTYASTTAEVKRIYDRMTFWDVANRALGFAMQFFLAVGLTPVLAFYWSLFPLMWLAGYHLVTGREFLTAPKERFALIAAVVLEVISTYLIYPYRHLIPLALQWTMPLITAAVGVILALLYLRRRDEPSLFGGFFVFALVHGVLQVLLFLLLS